MVPKVVYIPKVGPRLTVLVSGTDSPVMLSGRRGGGEMEKKTRCG